MSMSWHDQGTSFRLDVFCLILALAVHVPLLFMKMDPKKKAIDRPLNRLVSVDLIEEIAPKAVVPPPPPVPVKDTGLMAKLKALVRSEPPPPPPKPVEPPKKLDAAPQQIKLDAKLKMPEKISPTLNSKSGFKTTADAKLVEEKKIELKSLGAGIAPLSAKKLGATDDRAQIKSDKGRFQMAQNESVEAIGGGSGARIADSAAPVIAIRTGKTGSQEKFSAPPVQKADKGKLGSVGVAGLGETKQLGLRDTIIARDAAPTAIGGTSRGSVGGSAPVAAVKRDAGRFEGGSAGGALGGSGSAVTKLASAKTALPAVVPVQQKKEKKSMFVITGPLKDRKIERQILPEYPSWAQAQGIEAAVVLEFTVDPMGFVKEAVVVRRTSGYPRLDESAIRALRQWKFAALDGSANREEVGTITFNYSLN